MALGVPILKHFRVSLPSLEQTEVPKLENWLIVLGLAALWDSISVYIGPSPRDREKGEKG